MIKVGSAAALKQVKAKWVAKAVAWSLQGDMMLAVTKMTTTSRYLIFLVKVDGPALAVVIVEAARQQVLRTGVGAQGRALGYLR